MDIEKLKKGEPLNIWLKAISEASKNQETEEYKEWTKKNEKIVEKVKKLLKEFYKNRKVKEVNKLIIRGTRLNFKFESDIDIDSESVRKELNQLLPARRAEMAAFTEFLKKKYWEE